MEWTAKMKLFFQLLLLAALAGCGAKSSAPPAGKPAGHELPLPEIPAMLVDDSSRLDYLSAHYWDGFDFKDTTWIADTAALEQAFADWTGILMKLPADRACELSGDVIRQSGESPAMLLRLAEIAEHYFNNPNSPFRNESLFIPVLRAMLESDSLGAEEKLRPQLLLDAAMKNRPGMHAADIVYTTASGGKGRLSRLGGDYLLLLFYNPGCADCARVLEYLSKSQSIGELLRSHRLTLLALYPDKDLELWRKYLPEMPDSWVVAYDAEQAVNEKETYVLPAIPTLYLLDRDKRVLLKDAPVEQVEYYLKKHVADAAD